MCIYVCVYTGEQQESRGKVCVCVRVCVYLCVRARVRVCTCTKSSFISPACCSPLLTNLPPRARGYTPAPRTHDLASAG